jgi:hypothetical protein
VTARALPLMLVLAACAPTAEDKAALVAEAKVAIAKEIESRASAEFRNVRVAPETGAEIIGTVCGEVRSAKDQPLDAPFRRFIYSKANDLRAVEGLPSDDPEIRNAPETVAFQKEFDGFWAEFCQ